MKIFSIYKSMEESVALCPAGANIKLVIRHSIRHETSPTGNDSDVPLYEEGRILARRLGESLDMTVGSISSSLTQRCMDTCSEIIKGIQEIQPDFNITIQRAPMLQIPQNKDNIEAGRTFGKPDAIRNIFQAFVDKEPLPGLYDLETGAKRMLTYIFDTGNTPGTLDIFCTHDFQFSMQLLFLQGGTQEVKDHLFNGCRTLRGDGWSINGDGWPLMLEGMFLWGTKDNFTAVWRGEKCEVRL